MSKMTNSEEPSAPDGISSMSSSTKVSENFGNVGEMQHNQIHQNNYNYVNGDPNPKKSLGNGTAILPPPTTGGSAFGSCASASPYVPTTASSTNCDPDNYSLHPPSSSQSTQHHQPPTLPFNLICGEVVEHKAEISDGILVLTTYRLFLQTKEATYNLPLGLIEQVECRDIFFLHLNCKDARYIRCTFPNNEAALEMIKRIQSAISPPKKLEENFAFSFYEKTKESVSDDVKAHLGLDLAAFPSPKERFDAEVKRMEFNVQGPWRVSDENKDYELCGSYPTHIIVPCVMDKKKLEQVACFRSARRFPAVVWRHKGNGAVISRCSQPEVGWFGWRSNEDEELVQNIVLACADNGKAMQCESLYKNQVSFSPGSSVSDGETDGLSSSIPAAACGSLSSIEVVPDPPNIKKLLILDARSYSTAVVNRARGGGCECLEYYTNCEIQFMNLANIHSIRKSFMNVRQLCSLPADQANWYSQLESCKWLQHMSGLMKAAVTVATAIENEGRPVMVHCSDGWDRTPQIVALAEILLDPYYRSLEGFQVLVEREWLDFGHKFADRCGQGKGSDDTNERCPVFLQWLDCLSQLLRQFPTAFEFNLTFLVKLAQHTYSNLFGTFLCNTAKERHAMKIHKLTHSIWRFLRAPANYEKFRNNLYTSCDKVLWPSCEVRELTLWAQVYLGYDNPPPVLTEVINPSQESSPAPSVAADCESSDRISSCKSLDKSKARSSSCENLLVLHHTGGLQRRQSDPNLSDSFLGDDQEEVESRCLPQTEKMLTAASADINDGEIIISKNGIEPHENGLKMQDCGSVVCGGGGGVETEDFSENDDTETNSEGKSESTVVNLLKSIESSTDTLVAELGVLHEPSSSHGNPNHQKLVNEVLDIKTECVESNRNIKEDVSNKTESEILGESSSRDTRTSNKESEYGNTLNLKGKSSREIYEFPSTTNSTVEKVMKSELSQNEVDLEGILTNQQCEVCATSRKLLLGDAVSNNSTSNSIITSSSAGSSSSNNNSNNSSSTGNCIQNVPVSSALGNNSSGSSGSKFSSYNTPMHSRTPSTGIPATPEESSYQLSRNGSQDKWNPEATPPSISLPGTKSSYDVDGLESLHDEVQSRLNVIVSNYRGQIDNLQRELQMTRDALMKQVCHKCTHHIIERQDDAASVADSLCSGEHHSVGHDSHSSEISWEAVDEKDTRPPLWLPDYAVTRCMGCEASFWLGRRKHHCRSCGKIFCADCSENTTTIPSEQLFTPVRVCTSCFYRLNHHSTNGIGSHPYVNGNGLVNGNGPLTHHHHVGESSRPMNNGFHRGSASDCLQVSSTSPKSNNATILQRRLSEEIPRSHNQNHWNGKLNSEFSSCNGVKQPSKQKSTDGTYPAVNNLLDDATVTNGHS